MINRFAGSPYTSFSQPRVFFGEDATAPSTPAPAATSPRWVGTAQVPRPDASEAPEVAPAPSGSGGRTVLAVLATFAVTVIVSSFAFLSYLAINRPAPAAAPGTTAAASADASASASATPSPSPSATPSPSPSTPTTEPTSGPTTPEPEPTTQPPTPQYTPNDTSVDNLLYILGVAPDDTDRTLGYGLLESAERRVGSGSPAGQVFGTILSHYRDCGLTITVADLWTIANGDGDVSKEDADHLRDTLAWAC